MGEAPWKQQQRSSAFKWIKTLGQSPGPAGIGQTGCSLDEDLRLIISHAAFVFAATVACIGRTAARARIRILYVFGRSIGKHVVGSFAGRFPRSERAYLSVCV